MISKATEKECFVYITLPGQTEFVTAGKLVLATDRRGNPSGKFVYGRSWFRVVCCGNPSFSKSFPKQSDPLSTHMTHLLEQTQFQHIFLVKT